MTHQPPAILPQAPAFAEDHERTETFTDTTATSSQSVSLSPSPGAEPVPTSAERARYTILTDNRQAVFLKSLQLFGNVRLACRSASVSAQTAYRARRRSAGFALAWDAALVAARAHAEATLADRAINGVEEAVFYHGEEVARRKRYDSRLLLAHLARLDRLEEREEVAEALPLLDEAIERLEEGVSLEDSMTPTVRPELAGPEEGAQRERAPFSSARGAKEDAGLRQAQHERKFEPQDRVPPVPSCRNGARGKGEEALPPVERRLRAMEAARPEGALKPHQLASEDRDAGEVEQAQLAAFEAGEARWWEVVCGDGGRAPGGSQTAGGAAP
ncbi:MAG: hypothetical protein QNI87_05880 [Erythrobacter sp.]|uniref:hypothetical protein n=1 Tax=Erythrobacter sp. TaxID=1042 RepID=UPI002631067F|nr:hypothetical protein [Erythrobacter sp.]MDJ0978046.1 hypothetical protein [Erythrobacter sp.]